LRCVKNRYGSTNEIGVFEMGESGLTEVENPSMMLLSGRPINVSGACVACTIEGTRPMLAEVQGLVSPTGFGNPRRMATGFDYNRLSLILAVLEKRAGYLFSNLDTYVNVVGGLWLDEPAMDLPVALALISGLKDVTVSSDTVAFGEIDNSFDTTWQVLSADTKALDEDAYNEKFSMRFWALCTYSDGSVQASMPHGIYCERSACEIASAALADTTVQYESDIVRHLAEIVSATTA
jgi:hypothetical protein